MGCDHIKLDWEDFGPKPDRNYRWWVAKSGSTYLKVSQYEEGSFSWESYWHGPGYEGSSPTLDSAKAAAEACLPCPSCQSALAYIQGMKDMRELILKIVYQHGYAESYYSPTQYDDLAEEIQKIEVKNG